MQSIEPKHDVFHAIADKHRRKILIMLANNEKSITSITDEFTISRTAVNKHLTILYESNLVTKKKAGRETRYKTQAQELKKVNDWLQYFDVYWDNKLESLKNYVNHN
ncbi:ArsR family transcriptional regulator [Mammaliicoccus sciuri]|uniref:ArsR family transcriptional regulator n=1 Tax=Mammaliicoccus sciuri TaxID=1296 RepID=A0AAJ4SHB1_MAMSC|nr:metalloregulator ArsR/SmtB family transcription factor [Mammaliicoccus sciuri]RTX72580.1 ArsR family transcriptional regulator [Mammaliicoccus sciuri]